MTDAHTHDPFLAGLRAVLAETFEGAAPEGPLYLDGTRNAGLFATLNRLTAEQASRPTPLGASVAGHAAHVRFQFEATLAALRGEPLELDWSRAWDVQEVDEAGWRDLRAGLHDAYHAARNLLDARPAWDAEEAAGLFAAVTHAAYHLAVVRQLLKFVAPQGL